MQKHQAARNKRRAARRLSFIATVAAIVSISGFNGHFANPYTGGSPIWMPTRSQRVKVKIRARQHNS